MNLRIRELVKRAGGHFSSHNLMSNPVQHRESIELWDKNIEKFAELIVEECVKIANEQFSVASGLDDRDCWTAVEIKKHFGVDE